jgi:transketolase N-terminal domain/subunit
MELLAQADSMGYVVGDLSLWPSGAFPDAGLQSIAEGAGVTIANGAAIGGRVVQMKATVYAVADHGTPQH